MLVRNTLASKLLVLHTIDKVTPRTFTSRFEENHIRGEAYQPRDDSQIAVFGLIKPGVKFKTVVELDWTFRVLGGGSPWQGF